MENRKRVQKVFTRPSLTRQSFKDECDLQVLLKRFKAVPGGIEALLDAGSVSRYADVSNVPSFQEVNNLLISAKDKFMQLPEKLRQRFNNDPAYFVDFCHDPSNLKEMESLGLVSTKKEAPVEGGKA